jgi:hypothetical protein
MESHRHILGHEQLVSVFGYWPSFHDAEVVWLHLDRHGTALGPGPSLEAMIHAFQMTSETDPHGYLALRNHVLVHLRFAGIASFRCDSFYSQYALSELDITEVGAHDSNGLPFEVGFNSVYGAEGIFFRCRQIELVAVQPCDATGEALAF